MNCWELRWKWSLPYIRYADSCLILWKRIYIYIYIYIYIQQKLAEVTQILGILNNTLRPSLVQKSWRIKVYIMQWLSPCFYMEEKSGASGERIQKKEINPLNPELNPICYFLALLGAHHFLHVSRIRVKLLTFRLLMLYIYGEPILDVSRSHTTTQHSR